MQTKSNIKLPTHYYNIASDLQKHLGVEIPAPLHPGTKKPIGPADLVPLFSMEVIKQEVSTEQYIEIPKEVAEVYDTYRPTALIRAKGLEKVLGTPAKIFFKFEGATLTGSHKINTAIPQAFYAKNEGVKRLATETGAGQWGTALATAGSIFGLDIEVFMVKTSFDQKPYRKTAMELLGATVHASPSPLTEAGKKFLAANPDSTGSLGMAIAEAVEIAVKNEDTKYALGSVLNHVLLHQTIIGQEAIMQMEEIGEKPDLIIGCVGGGSNFAGIAFPYIKKKFEGAKIDFIAVEPEACPSLTKGEYKYDFGDSGQMTPMVKMYTLGSEFMPSAIHAGGLRYHGMAPLISLLVDQKVITPESYSQLETFEAAQIFARSMGIIPAPESAHAIKAVIKQALLAKEKNEEKTILFNLSGTGYFDMNAYEDYLGGKLK
ncbi:MAG: TrpB-like pyridoxal phosphate-dependent enzyme [bacterium]